MRLTSAELTMSGCTLRVRQVIELHVSKVIHVGKCVPAVNPTLLLLPLCTTTSRAPPLSSAAPQALHRSGPVLQMPRTRPAAPPAPSERACARGPPQV